MTQLDAEHLLNCLTSAWPNLHFIFFLNLLLLKCAKVKVNVLQLVIYLCYMSLVDAVYNGEEWTLSLLYTDYNLKSVFIAQVRVSLRRNLTGHLLENHKNLNITSNQRFTRHTQSVLYTYVHTAYSNYTNGSILTNAFPVKCSSWSP